MHRSSLRARLLAVTLALVALGLAIASVASYAALSSFLNNRVDKMLFAADQTMVSGLNNPRFGPGEVDALASGSPGVYIQLRDRDETVIFVQRARRAGERSYTPNLPAHISSDETGAVAPVSNLFTVSALEDGGPSYRVRTTYVPSVGLSVIVAAPLDDVADTLRQLVVVEIAVSLAVLLGVGIAGFWLIKLGLRPLDDIGRTAAAIADGDLTRRVDRADTETEVGRLGLALNAMLGHIERAFDERAASEARLRRFVSDASHELRTPLSAVRAYAELFRRGAGRDPADLARTMSGIEAEAERMGVLVDDLLLLARLDEGRPLESVPVDLAEIVGSAVQAARAIDSTHPIEFWTVPSAEVVGDQVRLRQVVDNLLSNVRTHTPPGTTGSVTVVQRDGACVLEVSDNGPGLTDAEAEKVFERFYRGDPSRSRRSGGTGLGLAIVAAIVEAHGGRAAAGRAPAGGTVFTVALPAAPDEPERVVEDDDDSGSLPGGADAVAIEQEARFPSAPDETADGRKQPADARGAAADVA